MTTTTTALEQINAKVEELQKRYKAALSKKGAYSGILQAKREELAALIKDVEAAGLDPRTLKETCASLKSSLEADMEKFEKDLAEVEEAYASFESNATKKQG